MPVRKTRGACLTGRDTGRYNIAEMPAAGTNYPRGKEAFVPMKTILAARRGQTRAARRVRLAVLTLAAMLLCPVAAHAMSCTDVDAHAWYAGAVTEMTERGVMHPDAEGAFRPDDAATRLELIDALWRGLGGSVREADEVSFPDLPARNAAVDWAVAQGVVKGGEDGMLRGGDNVAREEFAAMIWRASGCPAPKRMLNYADAAKTSAYAADAAAWCREQGLFGGVGGNRFDPRGLVTRAQTAAVLSRYLALDGAEPPVLTGCVICLDPGHCVTPLSGKGYREPVSPLSDETKPVYTTGTQGKGMTEEKLNLTVGLKLRDALRALGADVVMTREVSNITIGGVERCEIANRLHADVAVRIHADGNNDRSVHGVSVMTPTGNLLGTPSIKDESVRLGQLMVDAVAAETGAKNRGILPRYDLTGFNFSEVPSVLIEMGFMTNAAEDALLETDAYQNKIVSGMVKSLLQWYGVAE